ncbi:hypothetical protein [Paractinoplanes durhamensis]|uniref:Uncharacterized protein n=1 Tax=Paractinoplanes durhamensis TaxID=113563 RepID=A0ABQ3YSQ7_9ACTN|nr:hypothetical protein [Actinoplanes durhamensis]GIE00604.1 hypothetical protein Adu01nite_19540 [Actinoplanes durhamensis]
MSLTSLRSFTNAASLATTAFDTARSTLKSMADTAASTAQSGGPAAASAVAEPVKAEAEPKKLKGVRKGTVLDSYA